MPTPNPVYQNKMKVREELKQDPDYKKKMAETIKKAWDKRRMAI